MRGVALHYIEGSLSEELSTALESHLDVCNGCTIYLGQMRLTIRALERHRNGGLPPEMRERLMDRFRQWRSRVGEGNA
jgi:hypothetical protein